MTPLAGVASCPIVRRQASRTCAPTRTYYLAAAGDGAFLAWREKEVVMGKRRKAGVRCAVCGKPVSQTKWGYVHTSGKAKENGHVPQPMSVQ